MVWSPPSRPGAGREHGDRIEAIVIRAGQHVLGRMWLAERGAASPVLGGEQGPDPLAPVPAEDDGGDVLSSREVERGAALEKMRLLRDVREAGFAQGLERAQIGRAHV